MEVLLSICFLGGRFVMKWTNKAANLHIIAAWGWNLRIAFRCFDLLFIQRQPLRSEKVV